MERLKTIWNDFAQEEDGAALTEYVVLLGILVGGVIAVIAAFGDVLFNAWDSMAETISDEIGGEYSTPGDT